MKAPVYVVKFVMRGFQSAIVMVCSRNKHRFIAVKLNPVSKMRYNKYDKYLKLPV